MSKLKVAVIGCGNIANSAHIPAYIKNPDAEIKYFCDIIPERAEAAVEMAKLNLSYCVVVAPCDGKLGRRSIEEGQMVNAGTTITYIIPTNNKWVIANYKETQIENLYVGQKVRMTVDAISNKEFEGTVTAISGATGSKYSLVPTDNSAGNFVKIQQRVPVRIDFNNLSKEDNEHLAAGMMVVVKAERK